MIFLLVRSSPHTKVECFSVKNIDDMQQTYFDAVRRSLSLEDWNSWTRLQALQRPSLKSKSSLAFDAAKPK